MEVKNQVAMIHETLNIINVLTTKSTLKVVFEE